MDSSSRRLDGELADDITFSSPAALNCNGLLPLSEAQSAGYLPGETFGNFSGSVVKLPVNMSKTEDLNLECPTALFNGLLVDLITENIVWPSESDSVAFPLFNDPITAVVPRLQLKKWVDEHSVDAATRRRRLAEAELEEVTKDEIDKLDLDHPTFHKLAKKYGLDHGYIKSQVLNNYRRLKVRKS